MDSIWKPRCALVLAKESSLGISHRDKRLCVVHSFLNSSVTRSHSSVCDIDYSTFEFECRKGVNFLNSFQFIVNHLPLVHLVHFISFSFSFLQFSLFFICIFGRLKVGSLFYPSGEARNSLNFCFYIIVLVTLYALIKLFCNMVLKKKIYSILHIFL